MISQQMICCTCTLVQVLFYSSSTVSVTVIPTFWLGKKNKTRTHIHSTLIFMPPSHCDFYIFCSFNKSVFVCEETYKNKHFPDKISPIHMHGTCVYNVLCTCTCASTCTCTCSACVLSHNTIKLLAFKLIPLRLSLFVWIWFGKLILNGFK